MAEKKSFILYLDYKMHFDLLTNEQKGILINALFEFAENGEVQKFEDKVVEMAFSFISVQMKRDKEKYDEVCERRREAGKLGGRPKKPNGLDEKAKKPNGFLEKQTKAKKPDTDNDTDNDTDTDTDTDNDIKRTCKPSPAPPKSSKKKFGEYGNVSLTDEQYSQLVKDYGEPVMNDYIQRMDEYIQMKGKKYKDFNLALRNWIKKDGITKGNDSYGRINKGIILD